MVLVLLHVNWLMVPAYQRAEELCKEYRQTKGPGSTARPSEQLFFLKLGALVKNTLEKCQRENGFMSVQTHAHTHTHNYTNTHVHVRVSARKKLATVIM